MKVLRGRKKVILATLATLVTAAAINSMPSEASLIMVTPLEDKGELPVEKITEKPEIIANDPYIEEALKNLDLIDRGELSTEDMITEILESDEKEETVQSEKPLASEFDRIGMQPSYNLTGAWLDNKDEMIDDEEFLEILLEVKQGDMKADKGLESFIEKTFSNPNEKIIDISGKEDIVSVYRKYTNDYIRDHNAAIKNADSIKTIEEYMQIQESIKENFSATNKVLVNKGDREEYVDLDDFTEAYVYNLASNGKEDKGLAIPLDIYTNQGRSVTVNVYKFDGEVYFGFGFVDVGKIAEKDAEGRWTSVYNWGIADFQGTYTGLAPISNFDKNASPEDVFHQDSLYKFEDSKAEITDEVAQQEQ